MPNTSSSPGGVRKEIEIQCAHFLLSDTIIIFTNTEKSAATYQSSLNFFMSVLKCFENWGTQHQSHYFHSMSCGKWRFCFLYLGKLLLYRLKKWSRCISISFLTPSRGRRGVWYQTLVLCFRTKVNAYYVCFNTEYRWLKGCGNKSL